MPRRQRTTPGGLVHHVVNRAAGRLILFEDDIDYMSFQNLVSQAQERCQMKIIAYCLMRNHWHLLLWPDTDEAITKFIHWLCTEHGRRWRRAHESVGRGAVYQGRYRASAVQSSSHLFRVWRYIERNPLRAGLVQRAEAWPWSSLSESAIGRHPQLAAPPLPRPDDWIQLVNQPQTAGELSAVRETLRAGAPYGQSYWAEQMTTQLGWRARGRPKKKGPYPFYS
jgi:putative transposase